MENNKHLTALFHKLGLSLSASKAGSLSARISECGGIIVLKNGKTCPNTMSNRFQYAERGYIVTVKGVAAIPSVHDRKSMRNARQIYTHVQRGINTTTFVPPTRPERLESRSRMFREGMGKRTFKKPGSGGSFRVNPPLRGMGLNRGDMERNRPDFIDYCKYLSKK